LDIKKEFFDGFFFLVSIIVVLMVFIDWLIGKENRALLKNKIAEMWVKLDDSTYIGIVQKDANIVLICLEKILGKKWYSPRFFIVPVVLSLILTYLVIHSLFSVGLFTTIFYDSTNGNPIPLTFSMTSERLYLLYYIVPNAVSDWFSLALTIFFLKKIVATDSSQTIIKYIVLDILMVFVFAIVVLLFAGLILDVYLVYVLPEQPNWAFKDQCPNFSIICSLDLSLFLGSILFDYRNNYQWLGGLIILTGAFPTILHIFLSLLMLFSKLFSPLLKPIISTLLLRFNESEKGLLTQFSIALGAIVKLIQLGFKFI
jgi:hypothetical protein